MTRREPPPTEEGWYVLHDFRSVDWDRWQSASQDQRAEALEEGRTYLENQVDRDDGEFAAFSIIGHKADFALVHFREESQEIDRAERAFEQTALSRFTSQPSSFVSVTEVSGYTSDAFFEEGESVEDPGLQRYMEMRLHPTIPDADFMSFYPMSKRRLPEQNWYDLPFDERAEHMASHGEIGKGYAGKVTQIISGSIGFEDWEWGVTLFSNDPTVVKDLLYEMRFDPSTSRYASFGPFTIGRPMQPAELPALLAGEPIGVDEAETSSVTAPTEASEADAVRNELAAQGVYAGQPHGEDVHAVVLFSNGDSETLAEQVDDLVGNFDHYDSHVDTGVYDEGDRRAIVSIWETERAAETAAGFLTDLPGIQQRAGDGGGWETMGMFYHVKTEHREDFVETFGSVGQLLGDMDGHRETSLFVRLDDECDMFISSRWDSREAALGFFGGDAFRETVQWGRDVLQDRPRHVFLA